MPNNQKIENKIIAKGLVEPRVTPADIEALIESEEYYVFPQTTVTVCCLYLRNGFNVIGEAACANSLNFDQEHGRKIARENAKNKIWALEGYLLRERLYLYSQE